MSIRDKIKGTLDMAIRYYESLLEEGKPPSAAMAHTIDKYSAIMLAIEHPSKTMRGERCRGFYDDNYCTPDKKAEPSCPDRCMFPPRPATLADLTRVE